MSYWVGHEKAPVAFISMDEEAGPGLVASGFLTGRTMSSHPAGSVHGSIARLVSAPRLAVYGADPAAALDGYVHNLDVTAALSRLIALGEVFLRNALDSAMTENVEVGEDWLVAGSDLLCPQAVGRIEQAQRRAQAASGTSSHDEAVARLGLGFWVHLLAAEHTHGLWVPVLRHAFPHLKPRSRERVFDRGLRMLRLRNRVAHHEKVITRRPEVEAAGISELLGWIDPLVASWAAEVVASSIPGVRVDPLWGPS